jgi:hypothetical protein
LVLVKGKDHLDDDIRIDGRSLWLKYFSRAAVRAEASESVERVASRAGKEGRVGGGRGCRIRS